MMSKKSLNLFIILSFLACDSKTRKASQKTSSVKNNDDITIVQTKGGETQSQTKNDDGDGKTNSNGTDGANKDKEQNKDANNPANEDSAEVSELLCSIVSSDSETGKIPKIFPESYNKNCFSCHNDGVNSVAPFPALNNLDYQTFTSITRSGKGLMPSFGESSISNIELEWSFKLIKNENFKISCEEKQKTPISKEEYDQKAGLGLTAWRTLDASKTNESCANCHGPDPVEFAFFNYTTADLLRRGQVHVSQETVMKVADWVEAMRSFYQITPKDRNNYRPLQPGGRVLGPAVADNPYKASDRPAPARDLSFGEYLQANYKFAKDPINNIAQAEAAEAEILGINLRNLPVGIPFNRWTEDKFRGEENASFAEWIPSVDCMPDEGKRKKYFEASDTYLKNPGLNQLISLLEQADESMTGTPYNKLKCSSVQLECIGISITDWRDLSL
ncbi:MAG: cytochrome c [Oligoflexales bacterium]